MLSEKLMLNFLKETTLLFMILRISLMFQDFEFYDLNLTPPFCYFTYKCSAALRLGFIFWLQLSFRLTVVLWFDLFCLFLFLDYWFTVNISVEFATKWHFVTLFFNFFFYWITLFIIPFRDRLTLNYWILFR